MNIYRDIFNVRQVNFDAEKYEQNVELRKQKLLENGKRAEVISFEMVKRNMNMDFILSVTGLTVDQIWNVVENIDPLMYTAKNPINSTGNKVKQK